MVTKRIKISLKYQKILFVQAMASTRTKKLPTTYSQNGTARLIQTKQIVVIYTTCYKNRIVDHYVLAIQPMDTSTLLGKMDHPITSVTKTSRRCQHTHLFTSNTSKKFVRTNNTNGKNFFENNNFPITNMTKKANDSFPGSLAFFIAPL